MTSPRPATSSHVIPGRDRLRFALLGDVEPKPDPVFPHFQKAVGAINALHAAEPFDFVASIGDITHQGTVAQYEEATRLIGRLDAPFVAIMGNEEILGGKERFLDYAARWNNPGLHFTKDFGPCSCVFATAGVDGVRFSDADLDWLAAQLRAHPGKPIALFTHAPAPGAFPAAGGREIPNERFAEILRSPGLRLHFSGHTHMNPDAAVTHVLDGRGLHHVHALGIERTKVGDVHVPRFRVVRMEADGAVDIQTYNLDRGGFEDRHRLRFSLNRSDSRNP